MPTDHYEDKYTKPVLRRQIKLKIQRSPKGGRKCQWSARKSQMLAQEYERQGGDYKGNNNHQEASSLNKWTEQDWQTKEGSADARNGSKMKRYLPKEAWDLLTEEQKKATEQKKTSEDSQFVANTEAAKAARAYVDHDDPSRLNEEQLKRLTKARLAEIARSEELPNRSKMNKAQLARTLRKHFQRKPR